jgi:MFS transporter, DHA1 family, multidrug resistance protein
MTTLPRASVRTLLPLAVVTGTSMLAMDLYLPAVPALQASMGASVEAAQATVAVFLAGLAVSQLMWGAALNRFGPRRCVLVSVLLLVLASVGCALADDIGVLLAMRLLQGLAAGAATVVVPSVVRATLADEDVVRGMAAIAMIESSVPAAGPVLGTALLALTDWRATFWVLAAVGLATLPFALQATPRLLPGLRGTQAASLVALLGDRRFMRLNLSHALSMGALLTFVASAPQLLHHALDSSPAAFAGLQVVGVLSFMGMASQSARISRRLGHARAVRAGALAHMLLCAALLLVAAFDRLTLPALALFWGCFCGALAVREPPTFSDALDVPSAQMGRAAALLTLALLLAGAVGTQAVAPFMGGRSAMPLAGAMLLMCGLSLVLVTPYPQARPESRG